MRPMLLKTLCFQCGPISVSSTRSKQAAHFELGLGPSARTRFSTSTAEMENSLRVLEAPRQI